MEMPTESVDNNPRVLNVAVNCQALVRERSGVGTYLASLLCALSSSDPHLKLRLYTDISPAPDTLPELTGEHCWECLHLPGVRRKAGTNLLGPIWMETKLRGAVNASDAEVFWGPGGTLPARLRMPSVVTIHDLAPLDTPLKSHPFLWRCYFVYVARRSVQQATHVVVPSKRIAESVKTHFSTPPEKVSVVPHGVDIAWACSATQTQISEVRDRLKLSGPVILFVGNLSDRKNAITVVRAFTALPRKLREEAHLVIVGPSGCDHKAIQEIILSEAIGKQVHLVGYVAPSSLPAYFGAASVFVFPSLSESFGFPPLEAMAAGVPVICSNAPNLPETVGGAALLIPPLDVREWTHAMQLVLTDSSLQAELREKGRLHAKHFDWSVCATTMAQILRSAVTNHG